MDKQKKIEQVAKLIRPLNAEIAIIPETAEEVTSSGVYLPEVARGELCTGHVVAVGPMAMPSEEADSREAKNFVRPGDRVYFDRFSTKDLVINGHKVSLVMLENVKCHMLTDAKVEEGAA